MNHPTHTIRNIVVYASTTGSNQVTFESAAELGAELGAHVTGVFVMTPTPVELSRLSDFKFANELAEQHDQHVREVANSCSVAFARTMTDANTVSNWIVGTGKTSAVVSEYMRYGDLGIVRRPEQNDPATFKNIVTEIILASGRPVMAIPPIGTPVPIGRKVMVAWNDSKESSRALHDAIPLLQRAQAVEIVSVASRSDRDYLGKSVTAAEQLSRHGVKVTATHLLKEGEAVGRRLLNHADENHVDLLVAGAWGHTRIKEYITGGVTRDLLEHANIPVLFSH